MGITNELFQNEREQNPACYGPGVSVPNDVQNMDTDDPVVGTTAIQHFANFQRFLARRRLRRLRRAGRRPSRGDVLSSPPPAARTATRPRFAPATTPRSPR
jgi:hypothetical protein